MSIHLCRLSPSSTTDYGGIDCLVEIKLPIPPPRRDSSESQLDFPGWKKNTAYLEVSCLL